MNIQQYNFTCDFFAIILCVLLFILIKSSYTIKQKNLVLLYCAFFTIISSSCLSMIVNSYAGEVVNLSQAYLYFLLSNAMLIGLCNLLIIMCEYIYNIFNLSPKERKKFRYLTYIPTLGYTIYKLITPINNFDIFLNYNTMRIQNYGIRDNAFIIIYTYLCTMAMIIMFKHKKRLVNQIRRCLILTSCFAFLLVFIEWVLDITSFTCISFTIPVLTTLFLFHYNAYDRKTGSLDYYTFKSYLYEIKNKDFAMVTLQLKNFVLDSDTEISINFLDSMQKIFKDVQYKLFRTSDNTMTLIYEKKYITKETMLKIKKQVEDKLDYLYQRYGIPYKLVYVDSEKKFDCNDYIKLNKITLSKIPYETCHICSPQDIKDYNFMKALHNTLIDIREKNNLEDERVIVYFQPIVDINNNTCTMAEALIRLKINGKIYYPNDFLPIAEANNCSHILTKIVLNKVCKGIKELECDGYNINKVSINLSITDFMITDNYTAFIDIVQNKNNMNFNKIAFEILENTDKKAQDNLKNVMTVMKKLTDIEFYLDDFGDGYSNLQRLIALPIDVVKFDKTILDAMAKNHRIRPSIQEYIKNLHKAGYRVLFEGVENELDVAICKESNCDYLQGFIYSKPVPLNELKQFLDKKE